MACGPFVVFSATRGFAPLISGLPWEEMFLVMGSPVGDAVLFPRSLTTDEQGVSRRGKREARLRKKWVGRQH